MRHVSLHRSSGFRLAMTFTALFLLAAVVAGLTAYSVIRQELMKRHERVLAEQFDFLVSTFGEGDIDDLAQTIDSYARASRNQESVFLLQNVDGQKIAGNIAAVGDNPATGLIPAAALGIEADYGYLVTQGQIGTNRLTIATSAEDISEIEEIMLEGAAWAALLLVAISMAGGLLLARRMDRRIALVQHSLESVSEGDFTARIPTSARGDDIDTLTAMVNGAVARLGSTVEGMRQISNDISHDLKTPLTRLRINIEQAEENYADGVPIAAELREAHNETDRIIATFDALLRIAQLETGARRARFAHLDIVPLVADIADFYRASLEDAEMELRVNLGDAILQVHGDQELLTQLVANLIENTIRHCPRGSRVTLTVAREQDAVVVGVADDGPGIAVAEREKVLRRLYRLETSRSTPGSGLGLSTVKAIVDLHGAKLVLDDNHPGLVVTIRFPIAANTGVDAARN